jgi:hypothetical protein
MNISFDSRRIPINKDNDNVKEDQTCSIFGQYLIPNDCLNVEEQN